MAVVTVRKDGSSIGRVVIAERPENEFPRAGRFQWLCFPERSLASDVIRKIRERILAGDRQGFVQGYEWSTMPTEQKDRPRQPLVFSWNDHFKS